MSVLRTSVRLAKDFREETTRLRGIVVVTHTHQHTLTGCSCVKAPQRTTKRYIMSAGQEKALTKSCLPISANHSRRNAHRRAHSPSITFHCRLTTCKTSCSTQPALLITSARCQLHDTDPPPTRTHDSAAGFRHIRKTQKRNPSSPHVGFLPPSSDTLHPINEVSPLIFRTLICAAPEAALIQTECDNFNG